MLLNLSNSLKRVITLPAYQAYQVNARVSVITGSLNQVIKAFNACIAVDTVNNCASSNINNTLPSQPNATVAYVVSTTTDRCFTVTGANALADYSGCVAIDSTNGVVTRLSADTDISNTATAGTCTAGACTN